MEMSLSLYIAAILKIMKNNTYPGVIICSINETILTFNDGNKITIAPGNLIFVDPRQLTITHYGELENVALITQKTISLLISALNSDSLIHSYKAHHLPFIIRKCPDIAIFKYAANLSHKSDLSCAEKLRKRSLMLALMSLFLDDQNFIPLLMRILHPDITTRVCAVINSNIANDWSLTLIASELLMSPSLLKKKLQAEQTTYSQLLTECRMQQALKLLRCDDYAVKKTAILCGYKSVSYFIAVFRKHFGITPTEYQDKRQHHHDLNATKRVMTLPGNRAINDTLRSRWC